MPDTVTSLSIADSRTYSISELAREFDCPLCEILTPMGEALAELTAAHSIKFDAVEKSLMLA